MPLSCSHIPDMFHLTMWICLIPDHLASALSFRNALTRCVPRTGALLPQTVRGSARSIFQGTRIVSQRRAHSTGASGRGGRADASAPAVAVAEDAVSHQGAAALPAGAAQFARIAQATAIPLTRAVLLLRLFCHLHHLFVLPLVPFLVLPCLLLVVPLLLLMQLLPTCTLPLSLSSSSSLVLAHRYISMTTDSRTKTCCRQVECKKKS